MAFMHIPPPEFMYAQNTVPVAGTHGEDVSCWARDMNFVKQFENLEAIVVGHDHYNDWSAQYEGTTLIYGRKTGVGGYGPQPVVKRGARVFELDMEAPAFRSWIREEDGVILLQNDPSYRGNPHQDICAESSRLPHIIHQIWEVVQYSIVIAAAGLIGYVAWIKRGGNVKQKEPRLTI